MQIHTKLIAFILLTFSGLISIPAIALAGLFDRPDFFQKGYDQFQEEIRQFERGASLANPSLNLDPTTVPWSPIVSETAKFTLMLPPGTISQEVETVGEPERELDFNIIASNLSDSRYVIAYSEEVDTERFANTQKVLDNTRKTIMTNKVGLNKIADEDITFENYPGKQFKLQNDQETIVFRLILIKQRLYVLAVNQQNEARSEELINRFFESFKLLNN